MPVIRGWSGLKVRTHAVRSHANHFSFPSHQQAVKQEKETLRYSRSIEINYFKYKKIIIIICKSNKKKNPLDNIEPLFKRRYRIQKVKGQFAPPFANKSFQ